MRRHGSRLFIGACSLSYARPSSGSSLVRRSPPSSGRAVLPALVLDLRELRFLRTFRRASRRCRWSDAGQLAGLLGLDLLALRPLPDADAADHEDAETDELTRSPGRRRERIFGEQRVLRRR